MGGAPLRGLRVGVTRSPSQASHLCDRLRAAGADPVELPVLEFLPPESWSPLDAALRELASFDGVLFTSANAVDRTLQRARSLGLFDAWTGTFLAVAGTATGEALEAAGLVVDLVPAAFRSEALLEALVARFGAGLAGSRWLLPRAAVARPVLPEGLRALGAEVVVAAAYRTAPPRDPEPLRAVLREGLDVVTFASGSSVLNLLAAVGTLPSALAVASIGPVTSQACRDAGLAVQVEASEARIDALVEALIRWRTA